MKTAITTSVVMALLGLSISTQAIIIDTVPVGNTGNAADTLGWGAVSYSYNIGKYEVTTGQYAAFLNAVAATDTYGLYNTGMWTNSYGCKIQRSGSSGSYTYSVAADWANRPVNYVSWGDAARFANWLHNGQPTGAQGSNTTEDGAYALNGATTDESLLAITRKAGWRWAIASGDEWHKAAYHTNDGVTANYWDFPTGTDNAPGNQLINPDPGNNATYQSNSGYTIGSPYYRTEVGAHYNSESPYGTFDQGGNIWEWVETLPSENSRILRGGSAFGAGPYSGSSLHATSVLFRTPAFADGGIGFRVSEVPACPSADLNGDCFVDMEDLALLASAWLRTDCVTPNWCGGADMDTTGDVGLNDLAELVSQCLVDGNPVGISWVSIDDPGVAGHEVFKGEMSKYETTNAQYCQFLNAALASGDITVSSGYVYGANGSNRGADFVGQRYYTLTGPGYTGGGALNGGAARIKYTGSSFTVDRGFENHPVTYVNWYGATAFCNYYGLRLPTEREWQAVADYTGGFNYGCGMSINNNIANYSGSLHPDGTIVVGALGTYGYGMCDMAGNVWEWTSSSILGGSYRILRGGCWDNIDIYCSVSYISSNTLNYFSSTYGFRVCR